MFELFQVLDFGIIYIGYTSTLKCGLYHLEKEASYGIIGFKNTSTIF